MRPNLPSGIMITLPPCGSLLNTPSTKNSWAWTSHSNRKIFGPFNSSAFGAALAAGGLHSQKHEPIHRAVEKDQSFHRINAIPQDASDSEIARADSNSFNFSGRLYSSSMSFLYWATVLPSAAAKSAISSSMCFLIGRPGTASIVSTFLVHKLLPFAGAKGCFSSIGNGM